MLREFLTFTTSANGFRGANILLLGSKPRCGVTTETQRSRGLLLTGRTGEPRLGGGDLEVPGSPGDATRVDSPTGRGPDVGNAGVTGTRGHRTKETPHHVPVQGPPKGRLQSNLCVVGTE